MNRILFSSLLGLLLGGAALAQNPAPQVSVADIKMLAKAGLSEQVILSQIRNAGVIFRLTTAEIIDLKEAGVSDKIIDFMLNTGRPDAETSAPPPSAEVVAQATVVPHPPPPPAVERVIVAPGPGYVWVPGYHAWTGYRYVWVSGHWARPPHRGAVWVPGRYHHRGRGGIWIAGHWR